MAWSRLASTSSCSATPIDVTPVLKRHLNLEFWQADVSTLPLVDWSDHKFNSPPRGRHHLMARIPARFVGLG